MYCHAQVSMKSGLEGRNNNTGTATANTRARSCLNEVRPRRPEQSIKKAEGSPEYSRSQ